MKAYGRVVFPLESEIHIRLAFLRLTGLIREEIPKLVRRRDVSSALSLFDQFIQDALDAVQGRSTSKAAIRQRRRRGRILAKRAWQRVRASAPGETAELDDLAITLGLECLR